MKKNRIQSIIIITILTFFAVATIFPFYIMLVTSTKSSVEFATNFWGIAKNPAWGNFIKAWKTVDKYVANSFIITITGTAAISVIAVLSGYAFAKLKFRFKEALYTIVVAFNIIPFALLLVPMFMNILKLGIVNTRSGVILPCIAMGVIMPVILSTSFFEGIPDALFEAARMDGANELRVLGSVVVPLSKPIIGTVALFSFFGIFNQFMLPYVVLTSDELKTIPIGLNKLSGQFGVDFGLQMAAYSIVSIPLIILIASTMKVYLRGITAGSVKA